MEIAIFHPWLKEKGGAEKVVLEYARRSDHRVTVLTLFYDEDSTFEGFRELDVEVLGGNKAPRNFIDAGVRFGLGTLTKKIPDKFDGLVVSEAGIGSLITLRNPSIPSICYCHTPLRPALPEFRETYMEEQHPLLRPVYSMGLKFYSMLERRTWENFDHVYANSETTKRRIIEKGIAEEVEVLNPGVDVEENENQGYGSYFLYPTRFRRYKRHELAIDAFEEADIEEFNLVLAGSSQEEEYLEELKDRAGENVDFRVDLPEEEWMELYANSYSVLFCAEKEDWGIIPAEAASFGKPVISVDEGGPQESVKHGETGFLVEPDPEAFAEKKEQLAENPERVEEMGEKAREHSEKYSWSSFVERMDRKIAEVV